MVNKTNFTPLALMSKHEVEQAFGIVARENDIDFKLLTKQIGSKTKNRATKPQKIQQLRSVPQ